MKQPSHMPQAETVTALRSATEVPTDPAMTTKLEVPISARSKRDMHLSQYVIVPLSALMVAFALLPCLLYLSPPVAIEVIKEQTALKPALDELREENGEPFILSRIRAPVHYMILHAMPAIIWSLAIPLQHSDAVRKRYPVLHRNSGYTALFLSALLTISGIAFEWRRPKLVYTHADPWHLHSLPLSFMLPFARTLNLTLCWPTFEVALYVVSVPFIYTLTRAFQTAALERDYVQHRRWAVAHSIAAYLIHIQRVAMLVIEAGAMFVQAQPRLARIVLGLPSIPVPSPADDPSGQMQTRINHQIEVAGFAASIWIASVVTMAWGIWTWTKAGKPEMRLWMRQCRGAVIGNKQE
ncbi:hypothetical protein K437DRAFT_257511 [Tilletiaria anomala UBC 951]|uniref:Uncharacterized protein n=1 Tax=Tilletiaria anomala (strain ATCC 24038 / CBS 436.72 / UBC 951) TaxID=1037660 RepID=A0A066VNI7_TILAU|nr:uncharacterized protein K437DRAFT_257511 [Tilletiaria anomala UBC 951]KDN43307.1 hypothetical protein K437DRAFT_257511 [Tilletiaria anomala UBC 951]